MNSYLSAYANIVAYPSAEYGDQLDELLHASDDDEVIELLQKFKEDISGMDLDSIQELYTRTFDLKSLTCLDIGYVLFGEDYKRGAFLVELQKLTKKYNVDCGSELPDNLPNFLKLVANMEDGEEKVELIEKIGLPAITKIHQDFDRHTTSKNIYKSPIKGLVKVLEKNFEINDLVLQGAPIC